MGMQKKTGGGGDGSGQQGVARQSLFGTLHCQIVSWEEKWTKPREGREPEKYIDGKMKVAYQGDFFTFFNLFGKSEKIEEFKERYPKSPTAEDENYCGREAFLMVAPKQNAREKTDDKGTRTEYSTSAEVKGWKDKLDERDGAMAGTCIFVGDSSKTYYREARDGKQSFAQLAVRCINAYMTSAGVADARENEYILQCFGDDADAAYNVLSADDIEDGTFLYVKTTLRGGKLTLVSAEKSKNQAGPRTVDEGKAAVSSATASQTAAPAAAPAAAGSAGAPTGPRKSMSSFKKGGGSVPPPPPGGVPWGGQG